jgi:hypothetical protein
MSSITVYSFNYRVVSLIHAIMTLIGATWCLLDDKFWVDKVCGYSHFAQFFLAFTTGYMIYDIYVSIKAYGLTMSGILPPLLLHHVNIVFSFVNALYFSLGFYFPLWFMTNELSQPFLHGSWFMMRYKISKTSPLSIVNGLLIVITFLGSRFIVNTLVWYDLVMHTQSISPFSAKGIGGLTGTIHLLVNYYWCYLVILQLIDMLKPKKKESKEIQKE